MCSPETTQEGDAAQPTGELGAQLDGSRGEAPRRRSVAFPWRVGRVVRPLERVGHGGGRIEGCGPEEVLEEERGPVEPEGSAGLLVADERHGAVDVVEVEGEPEGDPLRHRQRVERCPGREPGQLQRPVLGRQRVGGGRRVHALGIGLERRAGAGRGEGQRALRGAAQPERAELHVPGQRHRPEQLRERAARLTPSDVHLEEPVLRVHPALQEEEVVLVQGVDVGDSIRVTLLNTDPQRGFIDFGR